MKVPEQYLPEGSSVNIAIQHGYNRDFQNQSTKSISLAIAIKAIKMFFYVLLFILLYSSVVLTFESPEESIRMEVCLCCNTERFLLFSMWTKSYGVIVFHKGAQRFCHCDTIFLRKLEPD